MATASAVPFDPQRAIGLHEGSTLDLEEIHDFAVEVILRAGALVRKSIRQQQFNHQSKRETNNSSAASTSSSSTTTFQIKASEVDLVTELDIQVEDQIRAEIEQRWPDHDIVAEESTNVANVKARWQRGRGPTWHVDPLDGTMNYTHALQFHCISIGFSCSHNLPSGRIVEDDALVGAIYAPMMGSFGTLWTGARGHGSYLSYPAKIPSKLNKRVDHGCFLSQLRETSTATSLLNDVEAMQSLPSQRLPLSLKTLSPTAPSGILLASEWGKDRRTQKDEKGQRGNLSNKMDTFMNLVANDRFVDLDSLQDDNVRYLHGLRSTGSSALDLAFVAQGSVDVVWEGGCWEWDVCGGIAIILESGGLITDSNPPKKKTNPFWQSGTRLPGAQLGARRFLAIRASAATSEQETSLEAQERVAREIWRRTDGLNYHREGVLYEVDADRAAKSTSSARPYDDPLHERKRLTREEAQARKIGDMDVQNGQDQVDTSTFGGRLLDESKDQWSHNAWDHVDPPASYLSLIEDKLRIQEETKLTSTQAEQFHHLPASFWNSFYQNHENRFFKDRKWLHLEFPELIKASLADAPRTRILEVGCGAGNTVFPLLEINRNPNLEIFACDYSLEAVNVVKSNDLYSNPPCGQCKASVWDLTSTQADGQPDPPKGIEAHSLDIVVLIFVLSALHPKEWKNAMANVKHLLKKNGLVLVRDYGRYDLPQLRFGKGRLLDDNFYVRGDGTRVYFFQPEEFLSIFNASQPPSNDSSMGTSPFLTTTTTDSSTKYDFETLQLAVDRRMLLNRKERKQMFRNWLQAKFKLLHADSI